jgi:hypothetical protein
MLPWLPTDQTRVTVMNRIELMIKATTSLNEDERNNALPLFRDSFAIEGDATLYDIDIYDHSANGDVIVKVLLDTELDQITLAGTVTVSFEGEGITSSTIKQIQPAF